MEQDLIFLNKGVEILIFDLNDNNDDFHILQTQSLITTWCQSNLRLSTGPPPPKDKTPSDNALPSCSASTKEKCPSQKSPNKDCLMNVTIRDGKHVDKDIEERVKSGTDILFVFGGTELAHDHIASDACDALIRKRITGKWKWKMFNRG